MKPAILFMLMIWFGCGTTESIVADENQAEVKENTMEKEELTLSFFLDGRNRIFHDKEQVTEEEAKEVIKSFINMEVNTSRIIIVNQESKTSIDQLNEFRALIEEMIVSRKNGLSQRIFGLDYDSISQEDAMIIDKKIPVELK